MANLPNAPLVYTIGVVHFPDVPDAHRFVPAFHDAIRSEYPHVKEFTLPQVSVAMGSEGLRLEQHIAPMWQFSSPDKSWAFILTPRLLALHTVMYDEHNDFVSRLGAGLERLLQIEAIGIAYVGAVGVRYVDKVVPREAETLAGYLKGSVLPPEFDELSNVKLAEGIYVSRYVTTDGELRLQVLRNPPSVLPPELDTPLTQQNGWTFSRPVGEFAILDIDHGSSFEPAKPMDVDFICKAMLRLRGLSKVVFENVSTDFAMRVWNKEA